MRVLLVRLSALGDVVHTWPLAVELKRRVPGLELTWAVEEPLRPLVEGHPAVDHVVTVATRRWRRRPTDTRTRREIGSLRRRLRTLEPELCLDPQGTSKSALVTWLSAASRRVGLARPWRREVLPGLAYTGTLAVEPGDLHVVRTNLQFLRALGTEAPDAPIAPDGRWLLSRAGAVRPSGLDAPCAVILPGTGMAFKIIPAEILGEVARDLAGRVGRAVVAWGPGEEARARAVAGEGGPAVEVAPPTSLLELTALLAEARIVVGGDTGPVHLSASLGIPTVAVHMATSAARNGPLGSRVAVVDTTRGVAAARTGRARVRPGPAPDAAVILEAAHDLLATGS